MSITGYPSRGNIAPYDQRYVGHYHYDATHREWDLIVAVTNNMWTVRRVNMEGKPVGPRRTHTTPLHADMFAARPFLVTALHLRRLRG